ncbi:MAG TPA: 2-oxoglutarate and iron-dependent oxygenase domain-containing protein [Acidimicrobiales bacterium]
MTAVPLIDISPLREGGPGADLVGKSLDAACREVGFFYVSGHGVDQELIDRLQGLARSLFARPEAEKAEIAMAKAGSAWRGWFPLGGELTAGRPDEKEGIYFGTDLPADHPRVRAGTPMHGPNLYPRQPADMGETVEAYMGELAKVGQTVLSGLARGLGLEPTWFSRHLTADPLLLLRVFRYPPVPNATSGSTDPPWSVGEHTDYGLLTILAQDGQGGLEVKTGEDWVDATPRPGTFVCNLGDMLERLTGGRYRSTLHRVRNTSGGDRLSVPFFFDPSWDATVEPLPIVERPTEDDAAHRWDHLSVHGYRGTYGDYISGKVGRVFPALAAESMSHT